MLDMSGDDSNVSVFFIPTILIVCIFVIFHISLSFISYLYEKHYGRPEDTNPTSTLFPLKHSSIKFGSKNIFLDLVDDSTSTNFDVKAVLTD